MPDATTDIDDQPHADQPPVDQPSSAEPERITVSGTSSTTDVAITMLEGATGARIPTGNHRASGAMPATAAGSGSNSRGVLTLALTLGVLAVVAVLVYVLFL